jgi:hypothetical protein
MKKVWVLCFVTFAAVFIDIVFLHSGTVQAQQSSTVTVTPVVITGASASAGIPGTVVGFSCTTENSQVRCYVASRY